MASFDATRRGMWTSRGHSEFAAFVADAPRSRGRDGLAPRGRRRGGGGRRRAGSLPQGAPRASRFREDAKLSTWFYRILVNEAQRYLRWRWVRQRVAGEMPEHPADPRPEAIGDPVLRERIARAVAALPRGQREAFVLVHLEGFTISEAAGHHGRAIGTIKSHLHRATGKLREALADLDPQRRSRRHERSTRRRLRPQRRCALRAAADDGVAAHALRCASRRARAGGRGARRPWLAAGRRRSGRCMRSSSGRRAASRRRANEVAGVDDSDARARKRRDARGMDPRDGKRLVADANAGLPADYVAISDLLLPASEEAHAQSRTTTARGQCCWCVALRGAAWLRGRRARAAASRTGWSRTGRRRRTARHGPPRTAARSKL